VLENACARNAYARNAYSCLVLASYKSATIATKLYTLLSVCWIVCYSRSESVTIATLVPIFSFTNCFVFCQLLCFFVNCFLDSLTMAPRQPKNGGRPSASQPVLPSENPGQMQTRKRQLDPTLISRVIEPIGESSQVNQTHQ
jgi:hypothetical protein